MECKSDTEFVMIHFGKPHCLLHSMVSMQVATYIKVRSQRRFLARFKAKASVSKGSGASSITNPKEAAVEHFERKQQHGNSKR